MSARRLIAVPPDTRPLEVAYRPLAELVPYARNARRHSPTQIAKIKASLLKFGWGAPMLVAEEHMLAGHARLAAALELQGEGALIPYNPDPARGPTIDLSHLSPTQRRGYILADNRLTEDAVWDQELLREEFAALINDESFDVAVTGFTLGEIDTIMGGWNTDFARHEAMEANLDPLMAYARLRFRKADQVAVLAAITEALKPFEATEVLVL